MAKQMPLHAELSNCLAAYKDTLERILQCIMNACDSTQKKHDSPIPIQVQDLLSIDAELKRHLNRMEKWDSRQETIESLEKELNDLSKEVNKYAQKLSDSQSELQGCLAVAKNLQKGVMQRKQVSKIDDLMNSTKTASATSSSNQSNFSYPWAPSPFSKQNKQAIGNPNFPPASEE